MNSEDIKQYKELMSQLLECEKKLQVLVLKTEVLKKENEKDEKLTSEEIDTSIQSTESHSVEPVEIYINPLYVKKNIKYKKTQKHLYVEKYSPLFKRNEVSKNMQFHPSKLGIKDGKVKYVNENIDTDKFKQNKHKNKIKSDKDKNKMIDGLHSKNLNDLKIYARELKIKGFSTMKKENLIKYIYEHVHTSKEISQTIQTEINKSDMDKEPDMDKELNENEYENEFFDDDDINNSDFDYE